jgi:hypothetical protein
VRRRRVQRKNKGKGRRWESIEKREVLRSRAEKGSSKGRRRRRKGSRSKGSRRRRRRRMKNERRSDGNASPTEFSKTRVMCKQQQKQHKKKNKLRGP